jgi:hypothetical protein
VWADSAAGVPGAFDPGRRAKCAKTRVSRSSQNGQWLILFSHPPWQIFSHPRAVETRQGPLRKRRRGAHRVSPRPRKRSKLPANHSIDRDLISGQSEPRDSSHCEAVRARREGCLGGPKATHAVFKPRRLGGLSVMGVFGPKYPPQLQPVMNNAERFCELLSRLEDSQPRLRGVGTTNPGPLCPHRPRSFRYD